MAGQGREKKHIESRVVRFEDLNPAPYNPRRDLQPGDPEWEKLDKSLGRLGQVQPLVWNRRTGNLVGGHQTLKVLKARGYTEAVADVVDVDEHQEKAMNLALNRAAGRWEQGKLADLLEEMRKTLDDLAVTGYTEAEADAIIAIREMDAILGEFEEEAEDDGPEGEGQAPEGVEPQDWEGESTRSYVVVIRFPDRREANRFLKQIGQERMTGRTTVVHESRLGAWRRGKEGAAADEG